MFTKNNTYTKQGKWRYKVAKPQLWILKKIRENKMFPGITKQVKIDDNNATNCTAYTLSFLDSAFF